jgi:hypothetical protein
LVIVMHLHQLRISEIVLLTCFDVGRCSSVGVATRYGLDGPGIEFR